MRLPFLLFALFAVALQAQTQQDESARIRSSEAGNTQAKVLGEIPTGVLGIQKAKGTIHAVDLAARTVSIETKKGAEPLVLTFSQPEGREQIKASKKAEKKLGKLRFKLEELQPGTPVQLRYYPVLDQVMELIVDAK